MATTPRLHLPLISEGDSPDGPVALNALANSIDNAVTYSEGLLAALPAAGHSGTIYRATDDLQGGARGTFYLDDGTTMTPLLNGPVLGAIDDFAGAADPAGGRWMLCNGRALSRATYAGLYGVIGTTWGVGDGVTTFNIPDLRGRSTVGAGAGAGLTARVLAGVGGEEVHLLVVGEIPSHTHPITLYHNSITHGEAGLYVSDSDGFTGGLADGTARAAGGGGSHNNMQPFAVTSKIIRVL